MIIQCKQCATKFRFKDELMTGDGVWVRCSRCGHEFFEINTRPELRPARQRGGQGKAGFCGRTRGGSDCAA